MKKTSLLVIILFIFFGCKKEDDNTQFKYFDFSFNNTFGTCFSIKFTPNDSIYLREHWNSNTAFDSIKSPKSKTNYIAYLSKKDRRELSDLISKTQLKNYNSMYNEDYTDGRFYIMYIDKDSIKKSIAVHSRKKDVPKELDSLAIWIYNWKKTAKLIETKKKLFFFSSKYILPPPPPPLKSN
ncbi:hypothetical protein [Flavobacterium sp. FlaQc-30]|uniref:hypothetical protein n=1 Tax=Flavobacterium sp. FlaQc-30 TaxID=3374179 RepID=UPI0037584B14